MKRLLLSLNRDRFSFIEAILIVYASVLLFGGHYFYAMVFILVTGVIGQLIIYMTNDDNVEDKQ